MSSVGRSTRTSRTAAVIVTAPLIVDEHFQVARLGASDDYRVVQCEQRPGARRTPRPQRLCASLERPAGCTGGNLNDQRRQRGGDDTSYLVLSGGNDARAAAAADPANDTLSSANLPEALTVNGGGQHLAAGDGTHDAVALVWHATHGGTRWSGTRPTTFVTPPDPQAGGAADGSSYTGAPVHRPRRSHRLLHPAVQRHDFTVSIPWRVTTIT